MIDLETANVASINSDLDTGLYIAASSDYTLHIDQTTNLQGFHISHALDVLLGMSSMNDENLVLSLKFRWKQHLWIRHLPEYGVSIILLSLHEVELSLVHQDFKRCELILSEVNSGLRHVLVDCLRKETHIPHGVNSDTVNNMMVFR